MEVKKALISGDNNAFFKKIIIKIIVVA